LSGYIGWKKSITEEGVEVFFLERKVKSNIVGIKNRLVARSWECGGV